jgi:hypothetical protein
VQQEHGQQRLPAATAELDRPPVGAGVERAEDAVLDQRAPPELPTLPRRYRDVTAQRPGRATFEASALDDTCPSKESDMTMTTNIVARRPGLRLALTLAAATAGTAATMVPAAEAAQVADWKVTSTGTTGTSVLPAVTAYRLENRTAGSALVYGQRDFGINLVWGSSSGAPNVRFERPSTSPDHGPLQFGEPLAVRINGGGYVRYRVRDFGINLDWSSTPVFDWRIYGGTGTIRTGASVSLYNRTEADYMVNARRAFGINLCWYRDVRHIPILGDVC